MDLDFVSVHKHAKKELGQYPAILTSHLVNNPYILPTEDYLVRVFFPLKKIVFFVHIINPLLTNLVTKTQCLSGKCSHVLCHCLLQIRHTKCKYRIYPCIMRTFFFVKLTFKFAMRIIHGSHCLVTFSLAYCKQENQSLAVNGFYLRQQNKQPMKSLQFQSVKKYITWSI